MQLEQTLRAIVCFLCSAAAWALTAVGGSVVRSKTSFRERTRFLNPLPETFPEPYLPLFRLGRMTTPALSMFNLAESTRVISNTAGGWSTVKRSSPVVSRWRRPLTGPSLALSRAAGKQRKAQEGNNTGH